MNAFERKIIKFENKMYEEIEKNLSRIQKIKESELYKCIVDDMCKYNTKHFESPYQNYFFSFVFIGSDCVRNSAEYPAKPIELVYSKYGYQDLSIEQRELLGMALIHAGWCVPRVAENIKNLYSSFNDTRFDLFTHLSANFEYWNKYKKVNDKKIPNSSLKKVDF